MSKKYFKVLVSVILLLIVALFVFDRAEDASVRKDSKLLLTGVNSDQISSLLIEQGKAQVRIQQNDGGWGVQQRAGYSADLNKLRSLLLKLIDLNVSQKVTSNPNSFARLGVADTSYEQEADKGPLKVTLKDSKDQPLVTILLGEKKKRAGSRREDASDSGTGQFARKLGENDVYLLAEPLEISTAPEALIATDLLSIPAAKVERIVQEKVSGESKEVVFELVAVPDADGKKHFDLDLKPNTKQEVQQTVVDSIASGLENVRIQDVQKDLPENNKQFDQVISYEVSNGAVYKISTAIQGGKAFAKYSVGFSEATAKNTEAQTERLNQKRKADYEQQKKEAGEKKQAPPPEFVAVKPDVITKADADKENAKYSGWIFEFPTYQTDKYRRAPADLIKEKAQTANQ